MHMMRMRMRRMSPGGVLTGRWGSKDRKLRPEMRTANQEHLLAMSNEMSMGKVKMKMLMIMLVMPMMMMMEGMREKTDRGKREIRDRERREKIEKIEERERKEKMRK